MKKRVLIALLLLSTYVGYSQCFANYGYMNDRIKRSLKNLGRENPLETKWTENIKKKNNRMFMKCEMKMQEGIELNSTVKGCDSLYLILNITFDIKIPTQRIFYLLNEFDAIFLISGVPENINIDDIMEKVKKGERIEKENPLEGLDIRRMIFYYKEDKLYVEGLTLQTYIIGD